MQHIREINPLVARLVLGIVIAVSPVCLSFDREFGLRVLIPVATAESGSGKNGDAGGGDNSGSGNSGSGSNDDDDDDDDDDRSGSDNSGGGQSNTGSRNDGRQPLTSDLRLSGGNLYLTYSNGWNEKVVNGRYILTDPKGRTVAKRRATQDDVIRMRAAAGK